MIQHRHPSRRLVLAGLAASAAAPAFSQTAADYPKAPIRLICSAAAGGGNDLIARIMAERLQANEFYTLYGVEFVDYDEKLYRALVASGASNGRVDIDDVKLGPL